MGTIVDFIILLDKKMPSEEFMVSFRNKVVALCGAINAIIEMLANLNKSESNKSLLDYLPGMVGIETSNKSDTPQGKADIVVSMLKSLRSIIDEIVSMDSVFPKSGVLSSIKSNTKLVCSTAEDIMKMINDIDISDNNRFSKIPILGKITDSLYRDFKSEQVLSVLQSFNKILQEINKINKISKVNINTDNLSKIIQNLIGVIDPIEFSNKEQVNDLLESVEKWIKIIKNGLSTDFEEKTNVLSESIIKLFTDIEQLEDNQAFENHVNTIERFVEAVNDIDIEKIESMTELSNAVYKLGDQIGNIDKFTNTLANKVSKILSSLTGEINRASKIILTANTLHEKRKRDITKSVETINEIMEKEMIVKIQNNGDGTTINPNGGGNGVTDSGGSYSGNYGSSSRHSSGSYSGGGSSYSGGGYSGGDYATESYDEPSYLGGSQTVEIDYNALAIAIINALKIAGVI